MPNARRCAVCGALIPASPAVGAPRLTCSDACALVHRRAMHREVVRRGRLAVGRRPR